MNDGRTSITPWKPVLTALPEEWVAFVERLEQQLKGSSQISPGYILDVRYHAKRVGDQLRTWQVPWQTVIAAYLWEYDIQLIQCSGLPEAGVICACIKQATLYARYIEAADLPPLLTPPYEDLGALLLATAIYFQTLQLLQEKSGDRPYQIKQQALIERIARILRNIFKRLGIWTLKRDIEDLGEQLRVPSKFKRQRKELTTILHRDRALIEAARQQLINAYKEAAHGFILVVP